MADGKTKRPKSTNLDYQGINPLGTKGMPIYQKVYQDENFHCQVMDETINPLGNAVCGSMATGVCHNVAMDEMNIPCHSDNDLNMPLDVTSTTDEDCHDVMTDDSDSCHGGVTEKQNISPACGSEDGTLPVCQNAAMGQVTTDTCNADDASGDVDSGDTDSDAVLACGTVDAGGSPPRYSVGDARTLSLLLDIPSVCDKEKYRKSL